MSDHEKVKYFFADEQVLNRLFVLYGNTTDCYRTASFSWLSFDRMLESHLKYLGYEAVIFYHGGDALHCYDKKLMQTINTHFLEQDAKPAEADAPAEAGAEPSAKTPEETPAPPARKKVHIIGAAASSISRESSTTRIKPAEKKPEEKATTRIKVREKNIPEFLNRVMCDRTVKSCVIFTNCWQIFQDSNNPLNKEIAANMSSWYGLPVENNNICVLLFNEPRLELLSSFLQNNGSWAFLYERLFKDQKPTEAVIRVGAPQKDEIHYQLEGFFTDITVTDELEIAATALVHENGGKLVFLRKFLYENKDLPEEEIAERMIKKYGAGSQEDALEKLRTTEGWQEIYELVKRLIEERKSYPCDEQDFRLTNLTNLRMAYPRHTETHPINMSIMLKGNPGTGKTTVTQWLGLALQQNGLLPVGRVVKVAKQDLEAGYVGQSAIKTQDRINEAMGGVLFVDEAYALFRKEDDGRAGFGRDVIDVFVDQMTSHIGDMAFVFAGYPEPMDHFMTANPGLMRRFGDNIVTIPDYSPELLERIALNHILESGRNVPGAAKSIGLERGANYFLDASLVYSESVEQDPAPVPVAQAVEIVRKLRKDGSPLGPVSHYFNNWYADRDRKSFGNAGAAHALGESLKLSARHRTGKADGDIVITKLDFPDERLFVCRKPSISEVNKQMEDVVGMESVKKSLIRITNYLQLTTIQNNRRSFRDHTTPPKVEPGNYMFIGNPGTGKTMISEKLALTLSSLGIIERYEPVRVTGLELMNMIGGVNGVDKVKDFIRERNGGVLVIDEAHQFVNTNLGPVAVKALLDPMIEFRTSMSFVFCCYPEYVDRFLAIEPGLARRISDIMRFEDYSAEELLQILLLKAKKGGYIISRETEESFLKVIRQIVADGRAQNGGTAEKLLKEAKVSVGQRIAAMYDDVKALESALDDMTISEDVLYTITEEDVQAAYERLSASFDARLGQ